MGLSLQKTALLVITFSSYEAPSCTLFQKLNLLDKLAIFLLALSVSILVKNCYRPQKGQEEVVRTGHKQTKQYGRQKRTTCV